MLTFKSISYLFSRRIRPLLKAPKQNQIIEAEDEFVDLESYDFDKRQQMMKKLQKAQEQLMKKDPAEDQTKIVNRLEKGVVWGLGGQLIQLKNKISGKGIPGTLKSICDFLTLHQGKDIYVHDFHKTDTNANRKRYSIVASAFSNRHCYKIGKQLKNALDLGKTKQQYYPLMIGRKDDEWVLVQFSDFDIHILTQQQRKQADLQWKWNNPISDQRVQNYLKVSQSKNRRNFQPMDDGY